MAQRASVEPLELFIRSLNEKHCEHRQFGCPHCHEIIAGDEFSYGRQAIYPEVSRNDLGPSKDSQRGTASSAFASGICCRVPGVMNETDQETEIFKTVAGRARVGWSDHFWREFCLPGNWSGDLRSSFLMAAMSGFDSARFSFVLACWVTEPSP